ncbi:hypothetical protein [Planktothrix agardhii]|jgi:hypothetical protein|uniref:hypothetical protein n=1 Tax=Planktothrix agardhii TaxID=1160 RepID=UPI000DBB3778|nr:hypothetical protein [Planktothrix agardhii]BBD57179.1 hypothetical protein NIES204_45150 [Planktothrix agardhii NIES-204]MCB8762172.1 hypothetical protein [Planktothrix agardhii 1813]MCB8789038.1 hypothetical protein [Planktothrix agardhii 1025]MCF3578294.1 hypothetical protein [Planktothrix agardhii 1812]MCF3614168.1 hypothetical protein [Planktothrix agardhii 1027]
MVKAKKASEGQKKIKTVPPAVVSEDEDALKEGETLKEFDDRMAKKYPKRSYDDLTEEEKRERAKRFVAQGPEDW